MKLLDIDSDTLGIPETEYKPRVAMPSSGFTRIVPDLSQLGGGCLYRDQQGSRSVCQWGRASNDIVLFRRAEAVAVSGGKITLRNRNQWMPDGEGVRRRRRRECAPNG